MKHKTEYTVIRKQYNIPEDCFLFEASFKKKGSGKLMWVKGVFSSEKEAFEELTALALKRFPKYNLYGGPLAVNF